MNALTKTELTGLKLFKQGKVRDIYEFNENLLIISTDRVSTFDIVLQDGIQVENPLFTRFFIVQLTK